MTISCQISYTLPTCQHFTGDEFKTIGAKDRDENLDALMNQFALIVHASAITYKTQLSERKITKIPSILDREKKALRNLQTTRNSSQTSENSLFDECVTLSEDMHNIVANFDQEVYTFVLAETQQETLNHGPKYGPKLPTITIDDKQSVQLKQNVNIAIQSVASRDPRRKEVRQFKRALRALQAGHMGLHESYAAKVDEMYSNLDNHYNKFRGKLDSLSNRRKGKNSSSMGMQIDENVFGHKLADRLNASKAKAEEAKQNNLVWEFPYNAENDADRKCLLNTERPAERFLIEIRARCRFFNESLKEIAENVNKLLYDIYQVDLTFFGSNN